MNAHLFSYATPLRALALSLLAVLLAETVWIYALSYWQLPVTSEGALATFRLIKASLALWLVGTVVLRRVCVWCGATHQASWPARSGLEWHIIAWITGQVVCQTWLLGRSSVSGLSFALLGNQLPITLTEIVVLAIITIGVGIRDSKQHSSQLQSTRGLFGFLSFLLLLAIAFLPVAVRDLPRLIALSSDPDQHAFWATQVVRNGGIPWDQGILGIGPFGYPAGFAANNAMWSTLSGLPAVEIVTIQTQLQFLMAILCAVVVSGRIVERYSSSTTHDAPWLKEALPLVLALFSLLAYWYVVPYGWQIQHYHNAGAARSSASLLNAIVVLGWLAFPASQLNSRSRIVRTFVLGLGVVLVATFNPIIAAFPALLAGSVALFESYRSLSNRFGGIKSSIPFSSLVVIGALLATLLLGDPYYGDAVKALLRAPVESAPASTSNAMQASGLTWSIPTESALPWLLPGRLFSLLFGGTLQPGTLGVSMQACIGAVFLYWLVQTPRYAARCVAALLLLSCLYFSSAGLPSEGDWNNPLYLLQPYLRQSLLQVGVVLGFLVFSVALRFALGSLKPLPISAALAAVAFMVSQQPAPAVASNPTFRMEPRVAYCGSMGCVEPSDLAVLEFVTMFGEEVLSRHPHLSYETAPKILILGDMATVGVEQWVFPYGASRLVPLVSPLPVAFFYGRGSPSWSYENYRSKVCRHVDEDWLRRRNVRYLFIASTQSGCLREKEKVLAQAKVLFQNGNSRFVELF